MKKKIKVLSLFDGISCAQIALNKLNYDVEYYASEIDKYAKSITQKNYPNTVQLGDVKELGKDVKYPDNLLNGGCDLMIGGSPCFVAGTKIITENGYKNIEDIVIGDYVLTHKKKYERVLNIGNKKSNIYNISAQGYLSTNTTSNHPYYIREMSRKFDKDNRVYKRVFSNPIWKNVSNLRRSKDFIGIPIINIEENKYKLTKEKCWLFGRYVADGYYQDSKRKNRKNSFHYKIIICVGKKKADQFERNIKTLHYTKVEERTVYKYIFSSKELLTLLKKIDFGRGAVNKRVPQEILHLPKKLAKSFLDGYMSGDGCFNGNKYRATSISVDLCMGLNLLIAKIYNTNSGLYYYKRSKTTIIEGRTVNQHNAYEISFFKEMKKQSNAVVIDGFIWLPIKDVVNTKEYDIVYNLEVENDNSYTANNAVVHNCQDLSIAKKNREGLKGKSSGLFYEYLRILKELKPKYFILENVASMSNESKNEITKIIGVEPILINASLLSAQQRKRLFWTNIKGVELPEDKGIVLKNIIHEEMGESVDEKYMVNDPKTKKRICIKGFDGKSRALKASMYKGVGNDGVTCIRVGQIGKGGQGDRIYSVDGKSVALSANGGGRGAKTGLYLVTGCASRTYPRTKTHGVKRSKRIEVRFDGKANAMTSVQSDSMLLLDEYVRKLTPIECERLQCVPDSYTEYGFHSYKDDGSENIIPISNSQRFKCLGNAFNVDVVKHILSFIK